MEAAFNDTHMTQVLTRMQFDQQVAFGAACCERMLPNYVTFMREAKWGDIAPHRRALDTVWNACGGDPPPDDRLRALVTECEQCVPESGSFTSLYVSAAQDAVFGICALLDFLLDGNLDRLVSAARLSTDSVDLVVQEQERMEPSDPVLEQKILEHPLMQQELHATGARAATARSRRSDTSLRWRATLTARAPG